MTQDPNSASPIRQDTPSEPRVAPPGLYRNVTGRMTWWDGSRWVQPSTETKPDPTWSIFSHLSWFVLPILCPLLVRVIRGRRDPYSKHHSSEALNAHITFLVLLLALIGSVLITATRNPGTGAPGWLVGMAILIGVLATVAWSVLSIYGTVQASRGKLWRYPVSIRFAPGATKTIPIGRSRASTPGPPPPGGPLPSPTADSAPTQFPPPTSAAYPPPPAEHPTAAPQPYPPQVGYHPPIPPPNSNSNSNSKRVVFILLGVILVIAIVGGVVSSVTAGKGTVVATDVAVGDCLKDIPDNNQLVATVQTVACQEPHAGEVFGVLNMPDGDFPGQAAIDAFADNCSPALANYSPNAITDDSIQLSVIFPTAESWKQGDRAVTCIATLNPPRNGSLRG
jgi:uncharacterized Tic20 family protein